MTPAERARALSRCDAEIARIDEDGSTGQHPAWLIVLGKNDWEAEKRHILNEHVLQPLNESDPTLEPVADRVKKAPLCPVQILNNLAHSCMRPEDAAFWILDKCRRPL